MRKPSKLVSRRSEPDKDDDLKTMAKKVAAAGTGNDTMLAHITAREARMLKMHGGSGLVNRRTGLMSFDDGGDGPDGNDGGTGESGSGVGNGNDGGMGTAAGDPASGTTGTGDPSTNGGMGDAAGGGDQGRDIGPAPPSNPAVTNAIDNAISAGIFGGIGSPNPEAAANAQAGLAAVGMGYADDPTSSLGLGFASAMRSIMGQTPLGGLIGNNPMAGFGLASLAAPPGLSTALSGLGSLGKAAGFGENNDASGGPASAASGGPGSAGGASDNSNNTSKPSPAVLPTNSSTMPTAGGNPLQPLTSAQAQTPTPPQVPTGNALLPSPDVYANAFNQFGANGQAPQRKLEAYITAAGRIGYRYV